MPMSTFLLIARNVSLLPHCRFPCSWCPPQPKNWGKLGRGHGKAAGLQMLSAQKWAFMCLFQWDSSFLHLSQKMSVIQSHSSPSPVGTDEPTQALCTKLPALTWAMVPAPQTCFLPEKQENTENQPACLGFIFHSTKSSAHGYLCWDSHCHHAKETELQTRIPGLHLQQRDSRSAQHTTEQQYTIPAPKAFWGGSLNPTSLPASSLPLSRGRRELLGPHSPLLQPVQGLEVSPRPTNLTSTNSMQFKPYSCSSAPKPQLRLIHLWHCLASSCTAFCMRAAVTTRRSWLSLFSTRFPCWNSVCRS